MPLLRNLDLDAEAKQLPFSLLRPQVRILYHGVTHASCRIDITETSSLYRYDADDADAEWLRSSAAGVLPADPRVAYCTQTLISES